MKVNNKSLSSISEYTAPYQNSIEMFLLQNGKSVVQPV
jgi:hypothetical protein